MLLTDIFEPPAVVLGDAPPSYGNSSDVPMLLAGDEETREVGSGK
jgi:hypothetical protein